MFRLQEEDLLYAPLFGLLVVCLSGYFVYAIARWHHLITSIRAYYLEGTEAEVPGTPKRGLIEPGKEPHVTVAICAYNEGAVVPETIARACSLDWPNEKLLVQVYDDSTDQMSILLIEKAVAYWRDRGIDVTRNTRPDRVGYKAGNLRYNFDRLQSDYVAYFDADHRPERDFLRNTMPYFFDGKGKRRNRIALVQTPWAYHNTHQNILTESDSYALDIHHVCEQVGRSINFGVFGFNGTGGVWQTRAIAEAGGFTWETVTEDMLMSYRAYMKGYELIYARECPQCLEVPSDILAHIQQKHRWTKGWLQVFRIYCRPILCSSSVPLGVKFEFFIHVLSAMQLVLYAITLILYPHLQVGKFLNSFFYKFRIVTAAVDAGVTAFHAQTSKVPASNGHYRSMWSRIGRLRFFLPYVMLQGGMTPFEARAALEGLFSNDATFLTTPKHGAQNKAKRNWMDDCVAYIGLLVALHQIVFYLANNPFGDIEWIMLRYPMQLMNVCFIIGNISVSGAFLFAKYQPESKRLLPMFNRSSRLFGKPLAGMSVTVATAAAVAFIDSVSLIEGKATMARVQPMQVHQVLGPISAWNGSTSSVCPSDLWCREDLER